MLLDLKEVWQAYTICIGIYVIIFKDGSKIVILRIISEPWRSIEPVTIYNSQRLADADLNFKQLGSGHKFKHPNLGFL